MQAPPSTEIITLLSQPEAMKMVLTGNFLRGMAHGPEAPAIIIALAIFLWGCEEGGGQAQKETISKPGTPGFTAHKLPDATNHGAVVPLNSMSVARAAHTATLLKDGTVLICGGFAGNTLSSAEIYDPVSKLFTPAGHMATPRAGHSATLLPNGKVLLAGGYNGTYLASTELYDPEAKAFLPGPALHHPRSGHTATLLQNGKILFAGGVGTGWSFLASSELYDIQAGKFTLTGPMTTERESHTATLLQDGKVLITGGHKDRRENIIIYSSAEIYDPGTEKFSATGSMTIPRHKHDAVLLANGKVWINGGSDERDAEGAYSSAELFEPHTSAFRPLRHMNYTRYKHNGTSVLLPDNNVLIAGGTNRAELYEVASGKLFIVPGDMGTKRLFACATLLSNGQVLITGGYDEHQKTGKRAWIYTNSD